MTDSNGIVQATCLSLPYGNGETCTATPSEQLYATLDRDTESGLDHAMFRQYNFMTGRWTSPDPYFGSIDASNPQSFNRYAYVGNMPMRAIDPSGESFIIPPDCSACAALVDIGVAVEVAAIAFGVFEGIEHLIGLFDHHPKFTASHVPRPNSAPWDEYNIHYGANIGAALGLPNAGCEFGACNGPVFDATDAQGQTGVNLSNYQPFPTLQLPIGPILSSVRSTPPPPQPKKYSGWDWWNRFGNQFLCEMASSTAGDNAELFLGGTITGGALIVYGPTLKWKAAGIPFLFSTWARAGEIRSQCVSTIWGPGHY